MGGAVGLAKLSTRWCAVTGVLRRLLAAVGWVGSAFDNAMAESVFATLSPS